VQPTIRLLDAIASNPTQIDSLDFLVRRLEKELRQNVQLGIIDTNQSCRLLRFYAMAQYLHCRSYPIVEALIKSISTKIDSLQENDVISIVKAYEYIPNDERFSSRLFGDLNATVVESASENKSSVEIGFLFSYLNQLFLNKQRNSAARDLTQSQRETMMKLLEEKLAGESQINAKYIAPMSRILIRNTQSSILRD